MKSVNRILLIVGISSALYFYSSPMNNSHVLQGGSLLIEGFVTAFMNAFGLESREDTKKELTKVVIVLGIFAGIDLVRNKDASIIKLLRDAGDLAKDAAFIALIMQLVERLAKGKNGKRNSQSKQESGYCCFSPFLRTLISYKFFVMWRHLPADTLSVQ